MAEYRTVRMSFWTDPDVENLDTDGKLLYLYLFTSPHTNNLGILNVSMRRIAFETSIEMSELERHMFGFMKKGKVILDEERGQIFLTKFVKHQCSTSPKIIDGLKKLITQLTSPIIAGALFRRYPEFYSVVSGSLSDVGFFYGEKGVVINCVQDGDAVLVPYMGGIVRVRREKAIDASLLPILEYDEEKIFSDMVRKGEAALNDNPSAKSIWQPVRETFEPSDRKGRRNYCQKKVISEDEIYEPSAEESGEKNTFPEGEKEETTAFLQETKEQAEAAMIPDKPLKSRHEEEHNAFSLERESAKTAILKGIPAGDNDEGREALVSEALIDNYQKGQKGYLTEGISGHQEIVSEPSGEYGKGRGKGKEEREDGTIKRKESGEGVVCGVGEGEDALLIPRGEEGHGADGVVEDEGKAQALTIPPEEPGGRLEEEGFGEVPGQSRGSGSLNKTCVIDDEEREFFAALERGFRDGTLGKATSMETAMLDSPSVKALPPGNGLMLYSPTDLSSDASEGMDNPEPKKKAAKKARDEEMVTLGEFGRVHLKQADIDKYSVEQGEEIFYLAVDILDSYIEGKGMDPYKSHIAVLRQWGFTAAIERKGREVKARKEINRPDFSDPNHLTKTNLATVNRVIQMMDERDRSMRQGAGYGSQ